jgi:hypothetical protein
MHPFWCLLMLLRASVLIFGQRPLNTTTNLTNVLTEPFFVIPTNIPQKQMYGKARDGAHETMGIRNKERNQLTNPHKEKINLPPLNVAHEDDIHLPSYQSPPANRLHTVNRSKLSKFAQIKLMNMANANSTRGGGLDFSIGKKVSKPAAFQTGPDNQPKNGEGDLNQRSNPLTVIKNTIRNQDNQHTPSPPSYNVDDIDSDEKLGVKCSFEKPCAWTFEQNVTGPNFEVMTGVMLKEANVTGRCNVSNKNALIMSLNFFLRCNARSTSRSSQRCKRPLSSSSFDT